MNGMSVTGKALSGIDHLYQSIRDILTTPIGTRVMRRDYGSRLFDLMDRPMTPALIVDIFAAVAEALDRWEPRFKLVRIEVAEAKGNGALVLRFEGKYLPDGKDVTLEGIVV
jgi:phage baseplate assembly protein W